jgi:MYXO-CTERM domain-containing protein
MKLQRSLHLLAFFAMLAVPAGAQAINGAASGLASPASTITFESLTNGVTITNQFAGSNGVTFGSSPYNLYADNSGYFAAYGGQTFAAMNFAGTCNGNGICPFTVDISFASPVYGAAFLFDDFQTTTFTAWLGVAQVSTFSGTGTLGLWYGFDSSIQFDKIEISSDHDPSKNHPFGLDNVQVGSTVAGDVGTAIVTPEPASITLLATGLVGLVGAGLIRRRRNA